MNRSDFYPVAMTIAGSDSGGGAGIQADLRTFAALGVYGCSAITALTAQNPFGVAGIQPADPENLKMQIQAVLAEFDVRAIKTGMLFSDGLIRVVAECLKGWNGMLIVDPVMISTSGVPLLKEEAVETLMAELLPRAAVVTPNRMEGAAAPCRRGDSEPDGGGTDRRNVDPEFAGDGTRGEDLSGEVRMWWCCCKGGTCGAGGGIG